MLFVFLLLFSPAATASHLVGGELGYEYAGQQPNGKFRYKVLLTTYIDCSPSSELPVPETPLTIGVYAHDLIFPNADKLRTDSVTVLLVNSQTFVPDLPPGCIVGQNTCLVKAQYEGYIEVDANSGGYYLYYERCCRNTGIINLQPSQSTSFHVYIPPAATVNNSPVFTAPPIPFLCINELTFILNGATDADGDSLAYQFSIPYNGFGDIFNTLPPLPAPSLPWSLPPTIYVPGFSAMQPFGPPGNAMIHPATGISQYTIGIPGAYVIAVEVLEYRNGLLIGSIRRDLQVLALNCPPNALPVPEASQPQLYEAEAGDTLCLPVTFTDADNDSIFLTASGMLFDPLLFNPEASFSQLFATAGTSTGEFCMAFPCDADTGTFEFMVTARDNGCPPRTNFHTYRIRVRPPFNPFITGPDTTCRNVDSMAYASSGPADYEYTWEIVNGSIAADMNQSVTVAWGNAALGKLIMHAVTKNGCPAGSDTLHVTLIPLPVIDAMPDDSACAGDTLLLSASGSPPPYYWHTGMQSPVAGGSFPAIIADTSAWYFVAALPEHRCPPSDSVQLTVFALPQPGATPDTGICMLDTLQLHASGGTIYSWLPDSFISDGSVHDPFVFPPSDMTYAVSVTDSNGCRNYDTVRVEVNVLPEISLDATPELCMGDSLQLLITGGDSYSWSPPDFLSDTSVAGPWTSSPSAIIYQVRVRDTSGCFIDTTVALTVNPSPAAGFGTAPMDASCNGFVFRFTDLSTGANAYHWDFGDGDSSALTDPLHTFPFGMQYVVTLTISNSYGCKDGAVDTITVEALEKFVAFNRSNVFTPNGDGINDVLDFGLPPQFTGCTYVHIYNRWGQQVYEGRDNDLRWDGNTTTGSAGTEGIYFWVIEVNGLQFGGNATLMRK